jgi:hypothetical protein
MTGDELLSIEISEEISLKTLWFLPEKVRERDKISLAQVFSEASLVTFHAWEVYRLA